MHQQSIYCINKVFTNASTNYKLHQNVYLIDGTKRANVLKTFVFSSALVSEAELSVKYSVFPKPAAYAAVLLNFDRKVLPY